MATPVWEEFTKGLKPAGHKDDWAKLNEIYHATHLRAAIRIAEDNEITGGLIYDGVLRATRTEVVYLSPKYWPDGSRYGSIQFEADWLHTLEDRKIYWVESIKTYKTPICRFLVSRRDVRSLPVIPYDPTCDDGPIRLVGTEWYWANPYAIEIVIDEAVPLKSLFGISFIKHHAKICSIDPKGACPEANWGGSDRAKAALLASLLGLGLKSLNNQLTDLGGLTDEANGALRELSRPLINRPKFGGPVSDDVQAMDLLRAACLMVYAGDRDAAKRLMDKIDTIGRAELVLRDLVRAHFNSPKWELPN